MFKNASKENDLISIALWAAHRLPTKQQKKYVYEELLKNICEDHEYTEFINRELDLLVVGYDTKAYRKVINEYYGDAKCNLKMYWDFI